MKTILDKTNQADAAKAAAYAAVIAYDAYAKARIS